MAAKAALFRLEAAVMDRGLAAMGVRKLVSPQQPKQLGPGDPPTLRPLGVLD